jgi:hypothetical protein
MDTTADTKFQCWSDVDALPGTSVHPTLLRHYKDAPRYVVLTQIHEALQCAFEDNDQTSFSAFKKAVTDEKCEILRIRSPEALSDLANTGCIKSTSTRVHIATATALAKALKRMRTAPAIRRALRALDTASPPPNAPINCKCPRRKVPAALPQPTPPPETQIQV